MYGEDDDLCRRIGYTDYRIVIALRARMAHRHSNSDVNPDKRLQIEYWKRSSQVVFELKDLNHGLFYNFAKIVAHSVFDCSRNILRFNLKACVMFFWSDIKSLVKIAGILRSRKREIEIKNERSRAAAALD
jgi:GT2 family glycosyltransferase